MIQAVSRLNRVLREKNLTVPELHRQLLREGLRVNLKSLYRLNNDGQPLRRLDLHVAGAICQLFALPLSDLIKFERTGSKLRRLSSAKQKRLDALMARSNEGELTEAEGKELRVLVHEAEEVLLDNARRLAEQRQQLATP